MSPRRPLTKAQVHANLELRGELNHLALKASKLWMAEYEVARQRREFHTALREAHEAGFGYRRLAQATKLSWERIRQIVKTSPPETPLPPEAYAAETGQAWQA